MSEEIVTRFAPSPTGMLHIGGARTALFNWLFARGRNGAFRLRIEDTDRERSTPEATEAIISGLRWLGLDWDGEIVSQHARRDRHVAAAMDLLATGHAYRCFSTEEEIAEARGRAREQGQAVLFESPWRDVDPADHPDAPFTVRLKSPRTGSTTISDIVNGTVSWRNDTLDDMIILRSDGSPTYNFAVVMDDRDMGVTHVIRGDDHLSNSARQSLVYGAFGWRLPVFAHVPLIFSEDGRKLSKRTGDPGLDHYRGLGIPPEAMRNYLARLGWSHGDEEFFTSDQAIGWFSLEALGKSPARLNGKKLLNLSRLHLEGIEDSGLVDEVMRLRGCNSPMRRELLVAAMPSMRHGARTFIDLSSKAGFIFADRPIAIEADAERLIDGESQTLLRDLRDRLDGTCWDREALEHVGGELCESRGIKLGRLAQPVRVALAGSRVAPSIFDMMCVLGRDESLARLEDATTLGTG